jgi:nucleoside-diphosphate kinase
MTIQQTLVLVKPDGVQRGLVGEIIKRFEQRGLKLVALKLTKVSKDLAQLHYTDDIAKRRGEAVRKRLLTFITSGPVVAMIVEGVDAIENVRKIVGATESKAALPGTIRGDYSHISYSHADEKEIAVKNLIHASSDEKDAEYEKKLWFSIEEIHSYKRSEDDHVL